MSNNGLMTKIWGPPGWLFLHSVTMGYPEFIDDNNPEHTIKKENMKIFFTSLGHTLPCELCCSSYQDFIKELPMDDVVLSGRRSLAKWFYDIHNKVNEKLDVDEKDIPSFNTFYERYDMYRAKCGKKKELGCIKSNDNIEKQSVIQIVDDDGNEYNLDLGNNDLSDKKILDEYSESDDPDKLHLLTLKTKDMIRDQALMCIQNNLGDVEKARCILDNI